MDKNRPLAFATPFVAPASLYSFAQEDGRRGPEDRQVAHDDGKRVLLQRMATPWRAMLEDGRAVGVRGAAGKVAVIERHRQMLIDG